MDKFKYPDARILVFCKAPTPGKVKTRLLPALSADKAADLYERLAYRMINCSLVSKLAAVEIYCFPDTTHEFFSQFTGLELLVQRGDDLGERMCEAARYSLAQDGAAKVLIIGADCPTLDQNYLELALNRLDCHDAVLGPAEDGGYGLIGLKTAEPYLFNNVRWSTSEVCAQTCQRMNDLDYNWSLLPLLWDVDRPEDLERLNHI